MMVSQEALGEVAVHYRYRNLGAAEVELWLAEPPDCGVQDGARVASQSIDAESVVQAGPNRVRRYRVPPFRTLAVSWTARRLRTALGDGTAAVAPQLSDDERRLYLESSPQVPRHPSIDAEAERLAGGEGDPVAAARRFFDSLAGGYRYFHPVRRRGALDALAERGGDCGQFSALFAALCRARGIPARIIVGTRLTPWVDAAHVWTEFWADGIGWIPVDPSLKLFGTLGGTYFAFSIGFDVPLDPYGAPVRPSTLPSLLGPHIAFAGRSLRWGFETLDGRAPYLQPAYPRSYSGSGAGALWRCATLGHWALRKKPLRWTAVGDLLEQSWLPLIAVVLLTGLPAASGGRWLERSWIAAVAALALVPLAIKAWLRGALPRLLRR